MDKVIPSGAPIPQDDKDTDKGAKEELLAGKYKSQEDLITAHKALEEKLGSQGNELGEVRKSAQTLTEQLSKKDQEIESIRQQLESSTNKKQPEADDYSAKMQELADMVDSGELSMEQYIQQSNQLTAARATEMATKKATETFAQLQQQRELESANKKFLDENEDFLELQRSGELERIKEQNPIHDDVSAYYALKAERQFELGKQEAARLAAATEESAGKVLTKPGADIQRVAPKREITNEIDAKRSMMEALSGL